MGSCGPSFDKLVVRKDIMVKVPPYSNEAYFEFDKYSKSTKSQLFRTPTAPNFDKMLDRECDGKSLLPSFMQVIDTVYKIEIHKYSNGNNTCTLEDVRS